MKALAHALSVVTFILLPFGATRAARDAVLAA